MRRIRFPLASTFVLPLALAAFGSGCIINTTDGGDDDGVADTGNDPDTGNDSSDPGTGNDSSDPGTGTDPTADDTTSGGGGADQPEPGLWLYEETGEVTNDCNFLDDISNGWGEYGVTLIEGGFEVTPGDDTDPFDCNTGGGGFDCPERLVDEMTVMSTTLQVFVSVTGTLPDADSMAGTQDGQVICEGAECAVVEQVLETSLPCTFSVGFTGTHLAG